MHWPSPSASKNTAPLLAVPATLSCIGTGDPVISRRSASNGTARSTPPRE